MPSRTRTFAALPVASFLVATVAGISAPSSSIRVWQPRTPDAQRLEAASRRYLGMPYRLFPLGEGSAERGSPKPLIDERGVDCVTFVEQSLAHGLAPTPSEVKPLLQRIRYRSGKIHFGTRNHYFLADWMANNAWLVEDDTLRVGGSLARSITKTLDRGLPAKEHGMQRWRASLPAGGARMPLTVSYIPSGAVARSVARFPAAAIVAFVPPGKDMDASHVGFVFRRDGWTLRHASSVRGRVVDEQFLPYVRRRGRHIAGIVVLRLRDDLRATERTR
jgi:hypothetical protein